MPDKLTVTTSSSYEPPMETVPKSFGWTPSPPDHRDEQHAYKAAPGVALPPRVSLIEGWDTPPFDPVWDQRKMGSCGPHSAAADIVFSILRQQRLPESPMPSRLFIYYNARWLMGTIDSDSGVQNRALLKALATYGWCDEELWPYEERNLLRTPPNQAFEQAATRKIKQYQSVRQDLDTMKAVLAGGDPFILGFSVYSSLDTPEVDRTGNIPYPTMMDRQLGGHDVLAVGYDDAKQAFQIRNSWGKRWGVDGFGWLPYRYAINPQLAGDFWTVKHGAYAPTPKPEPAPSAERVIQVRAGERIVIEGVA